MTPRYVWNPLTWFDVLSSYIGRSHIIFLLVHENKPKSPSRGGLQYRLKLTQKHHPIRAPTPGDITTSVARVSARQTVSEEAKV